MIGYIAYQASIGIHIFTHLIPITEAADAKEAMEDISIHTWPCRLIYNSFS